MGGCMLEFGVGGRGRGGEGMCLGILSGWSMAFYLGWDSVNSEFR